MHGCILLYTGIDFGHAVLFFVQIVKYVTSKVNQGKMPVGGSCHFLYNFSRMRQMAAPAASKNTSQPVGHVSTCFGLKFTVCFTLYWRNNVRPMLILPVYIEFRHGYIINCHKLL